MFIPTDEHSSPRPESFLCTSDALDGTLLGMVQSLLQMNRHIPIFTLEGEKIDVIFIQTENEVCQRCSEEKITDGFCSQQGSL